jgi:hypothetical protein
VENQLLSAVADELEIRNVVARLAILADRAPTLDEYLDYFTPDAIWEVSDPSQSSDHSPRLTGRKAIAADRNRMRDGRFQGPGSNTFHVNTTLYVSLHFDGTAEAESYWLFVHSEESITIRKIGHYHDYLTRTPSGWKLARRVVTPIVGLQDGVAATALLHAQG